MWKYHLASNDKAKQTVQIVNKVLQRQRFTNSGVLIKQGNGLLARLMMWLRFVDLKVVMHVTLVIVLMIVEACFVKKFL